MNGAALKSEAPANNFEDRLEPFRMSTHIAHPLKRKLFAPFDGPIAKLLALSKLQEAYEEIKQRARASDFLTSSLEVLGLDYAIAEVDLERIPKTGPLLIVANHPFGGAEGLVLAKLIGSIRPDFKIMANSLLSSIPELSKMFIGVDPFTGASATRYNIKPVKDSVRWLRDGGCLVAFPAGEVSHLQLRKRRLTDPEWSPTIGGIIRKTDCTVVPMFIHGANDLLFQFAGLIHSRIRTALLPRQLLKRHGRQMALEVGNPITSKEIKNFPSNDKIIRYLRFRTYALAHRIPNQMQIQRGFHERQAEQDALLEGIVAPKPRQSIIADIENLPAEQLLAENREAQTFYAHASQIPNLLHEIGRLREVTFRLAGEGTTQQIDLDKFDEYYLHLFVWHKENREIIGAYRVGKTDEILNTYGPKGLYTTELFHFQRGMFDKINPALEMGRSFIQPKYQRAATSLHMLWKGIASFVCRHPRYHILFGPVSISNSYTPLSRQIMVEFLRQKYGLLDQDMRVRPRMAVCKRRINKLDFHGIAPFLENVQDLSPMIADLEAEFAGVPILLRQYLRLGAKLLGFNVDKNFNDAIDCLIFLDLTNANNRTLANYMGKDGLATYLGHHNIDLG